MYSSRCPFSLFPCSFRCLNPFSQLSSKLHIAPLLHIISHRGMCANVCVSMYCTVCVWSSAARGKRWGLGHCLWKTHDLICLYLIFHSIQISITLFLSLHPSILSSFSSPIFISVNPHTPFRFLIITRHLFQLWFSSVSSRKRAFSQQAVWSWLQLLPKAGWAGSFVFALKCFSWALLGICLWNPTASCVVPVSHKSVQIILNSMKQKNNCSHILSIIVFVLICI